MGRESHSAHRVASPHSQQESPKGALPKCRHAQAGPTWPKKAPRVQATTSPEMWQWAQKRRNQRVMCDDTHSDLVASCGIKQGAKVHHERSAMQSGRFEQHTKKMAAKIANP